MSDSPSTEAARSRVTSSTGWKIAVAAATLGVIYGYDIGNISGALLFITEEMALSPAVQGTVTTVLVAGNIVGALIGGKLATAIGRQKSMLLVVLGYAVFATGSLSTGSAWGFVAILLFTAGYNFGFGSMVWVFASESFPARLRTLGASLLLASNLVANLIVAQLFLPLMQGIGGVSTSVVFLALAAFAWLFVLRFAPETKGRPLESIRTYWENGARWPRGS